VKRLTKEELLDHGRFTFAEEEIELPKGSGEGVLLRTPDVENFHVLEKAAAEREVAARELAEKGKVSGDAGLTSPVVAADLLTTYCAEPKLTAEEWQAIVKGWPKPELNRVYEACAKLAGASEEVARAVATEFRGADD
jgi:hypothetical protein